MKSTPPFTARKNMQRTVISILLLSCFAFSQQGATISGVVREGSTGEPLGYTNVFIKGTSIGAAANTDGYYVLTKVPAGAQDVVASIIGYEITSQRIEVQPGAEVRLDFRLKRTVLELSLIHI